MISGINFVVAIIITEILFRYYFTCTIGLSVQNHPNEIPERTDCFQRLCDKFMRNDAKQIPREMFERQLRSNGKIYVEKKNAVKEVIAS